MLDIDAIREAGINIGADPLGGASVGYWEVMAERLHINLNVVNTVVDPTFKFMTLDWDEKIRMDCSSPAAMASLVSRKDQYQIATGNDTDADRHGIVTPDGGSDEPQPLPRGGHPVPVLAPARLGPRTPASARPWCRRR